MSNSSKNTENLYYPSQVPFYVPQSVHSNQSPFFLQGNDPQSFPAVQYVPTQFASTPPPVTIVEPFEMDEYLVRGGFQNIHKSVTNMGDFGAFLRGLLSGLFLPLVAALIVFAMETSTLARFGVTLGTGNAFLWLGAYFIILGLFANASSLFIWSAIFFFAVAIATYIASWIVWKKYMLVYSSDAAEDVRLKVDSRLGYKCNYWTSFVISLVLPVVGTALMLMTNRTLYSRQGALMGLSYVFVVIGGLCIPLYSIGYLTGNLALILGLVLMQCTFVHFRRAIESVRLDRS